MTKPDKLLSKREWQAFIAIVVGVCVLIPLFSSHAIFVGYAALAGWLAIESIAVLVAVVGGALLLAAVVFVIGLRVLVGVFNFLGAAWRGEIRP